MTGRLICVTGIDGAGKSTLARGLATTLRARGERSACVYGRLVPWLTRPLVRLGRRAFVARRDDPGYSEATARKRAAARRHPVLAKVYRGALLAEYVVQVFAKVVVPRAFGTTIVCDRYVYDTVVTDLAVDFAIGAEAAAKRVERLLHILPRPDVVVFLDLPSSTAMARKNDVADIAYLEDRRALYRALAQRFGMKVLDASAPPGDVLRAASDVAREAVP